jgi:hypothetical protein
MVVIHAEIAAKTRRTAHGKSFQLNHQTSHRCQPRSTSCRLLDQCHYSVGNPPTLIRRKNLLPTIEVGDDARNKQTARKQILPKSFRTSGDNFKTARSRKHSYRPISCQFMVVCCLVIMIPNPPLSAGSPSLEFRFKAREPRFETLIFVVSSPRIKPLRSIRHSQLPTTGHGFLGSVAKSSSSPRLHHMPG